jgi:hypothetical protein
VQIDNAALMTALKAILTDTRRTFVNRDSGETITAMPFTDLIDQLRQKGWRNVSWIKEADLEDSGFRLALAKENLNCRRHRLVGDWYCQTGNRKVSRSTCLVTL